MESKINGVKLILSEKKEIGLLYIDTGSLQTIEVILGWEAFDKIITIIDAFVIEHQNLFNRWRIKTYWKTLSDSFVIIVEAMQGEIILENLEFLATHLQNEIINYIGRLQRNLPIQPMVQLGYSLLRYNPNIRLERLIGRAVEEAQEVAKASTQKSLNFQIQKLKKIIEEKRIYLVFQPIVNLITGKCLGYEALARGPKGSPLEAPELLFTLAAKAGLIFQLENLCQESLIKQAAIPSNQYIFVNIEPSLLEKKVYQKLLLFEGSASLKNKIVIEITERMAIKDYHSIDSILKDIRLKGFKIAVDDVGSGYASLESIAYFKPDFIKINNSLIIGIHKDFIKQEIAKTLIDIAKKIQSKTIAEGIEYSEDLSYLQKSGVDYGQGFYFSYPTIHPTPFSTSFY